MSHIVRELDNAYRPPVSVGLVMDQDDHIESYTCRYCLDEGTRRDFIAPCNCSGTSKWVHRSCLDRWRSTREDKAFSQCTECHAYYDMVCITNDTWHDSCCRRLRFCGYFSRDLLALIFISQAVVFFFSGFIFLVDLNGHALFHLSKMTNPTLFYYGAGWFVALALVGMLALCFRNQCCESCSNSQNVYCGDLVCPYYCFDPTPGCIYCGPCESCASCECAQCSAVTCGEEMLGIALVVGLIFAVIGVFVSVVFGFIILQHIIRRHISILNKWNLTKEYVVRDLAPGALSVEELLQEHTNESTPHSESSAEHDQMPHSDQNFVGSMIHVLSGGAFFSGNPYSHRDGTRGGHESYGYRSLVPNTDRLQEREEAEHILDDDRNINSNVNYEGVEMVGNAYNPLRTNVGTSIVTAHSVDWATGSPTMDRTRHVHDEEATMPIPSAPPMTHLSSTQRSFLERNHLL